MWPRTAPRCAGSAELFPEARSYLDVYARHGLLHERSVLAHGIWLDAADRARLHDSGAQIAFCPVQPVPGQRPVRLARPVAAGVAVSVASDVGGGTSLSMLRTLADGYKVQAMAGTRLTAWAAAACRHPRRGQALHLAHEIGTWTSAPGRPGAVGLGRTARWPSAATRGPEPCMNAAVCLDDTGRRAQPGRRLGGRRAAPSRALAGETTF
jgi:guanine deaminase